MAFVEINNLGQQREGRDILSGIDLRIEHGDVHALIGSTGSGKTTLLRLIALLDTPAVGTITIDGIDTADSEKARLALRRRMGFVLQKPVVFNASVYQNIAYGLKWRGLNRDDVRRKVEPLLDLIDLAGYRERNARTLSGGEMQRVAIARAIAPEPELLLLDEPTANLDPLSAAKIEQLVEEIIRKREMTVVMATHDMVQGQHLADCISVLSGGRMIQSGTPHDVFNYPVNRHVAEFVGMENIIPGTVRACEDTMLVIDARGSVIEAVADFKAGDSVSVCMRPEDVTLSLQQVHSSARNHLEGTISRMVQSGPLCRVELDCGFPLVALVTRRSAGEMGLEYGKTVYATFKAVSLQVIPRD